MGSVTSPWLVGSWLLIRGSREKEKRVVELKPDLSLWQVKRKLPRSLCWHLRSVLRTDRILYSSTSPVILITPAVHFFLLIPGNANKSISSPVSRFGLWPRAGWGSAYIPSRLKTESGPLLSAHYSGKGDMFGFLSHTRMFSFY